jgi:hypothetical protein
MPAMPSERDKASENPYEAPRPTGKAESPRPSTPKRNTPLFSTLELIGVLVLLGILVWLILPPIQ